MRADNTRGMSAPLRWTGYVLTVVCVLFLLLDGVMHVIQPAPVIEASTRIGVPSRLNVIAGVIELVCLALYAIPRTALLGMVLLTGYLGGATAIQLRAGSLPFESIFPVIFGALLWVALWLRDARARSLLEA